MAGRSEANRRGVQHKKLKDYPDRFRKRDQRIVEYRREQFSEEFNRQTPSNADVGFFPGCDAVDKSAPDVASTLELFEAISSPATKLIDTTVGCAGYPLVAAGYVDMFRWQAKRVAEELRGYKTVVFNCSACVHAARTLYPAEGIELPCKVVSLPEYLDQCLSKLRNQGEKPDVYYHDPCYLARYEHVTDEPRRVLGQIANVREFSWAGPEADCCGGAGLLPKTMPETADRMAAQRLREVAQAGGGTVVSGCGTCTFLLRQNAPDGVKVRGFGAFVRDLVASLDHSNES